MDPNTGIPWYMQAGNNSGQAAASLPGSNPFDLPSDIVARAQGGGLAASGSAVGGLSGPMAQLKTQNEELTNLSNRIAQLESSLPSGMSPASYMQRQNAQAEIDNMKMRRNELATIIGQTQGLVARDKFNISELAAQRAQQAALGSQSALAEFENLRKRQDLANQGWKPGLGFGNSPVAGTLMGLYNTLTGSENRMAQLEPMYRSYQDQAEQARRLQELAQ
jgi:hypothetical protein